MLSIAVNLWHEGVSTELKPWIVYCHPTVEELLWFLGNKAGTEHVKGTMDGTSMLKRRVTYDFLWPDFKITFYSALTLTFVSSWICPHPCRQISCFKRGVKLKWGGGVICLSVRVAGINYKVPAYWRLASSWFSGKWSSLCNARTRKEFKSLYVCTCFIFFM